MTVTAPYAVGQQVWIRDVNENRLGGARRGEIVKVGRSLVTVADGRWSKTFRMADGRANDSYGHAWIQTDEQRADEGRRTGALDALRSVGVDVRFSSRLSTAHLEAMVAAVADALPSSSPAEPPVGSNE